MSWPQLGSNCCLQSHHKFQQTWPIADRRGNMVIQSASTGKDCHASLRLLLCSPDKLYWHIHLCQWHTWAAETRASVSIYTCTYCPQYGVMERQTVPPTDIRPVKLNWPSLSSKLFPASIPLTVPSNPPRGRTYKSNHGHTHTHTKPNADIELCLKKH